MEGFLGSLLQVIPSAFGAAMAWIAIAVSSAVLGIASLLLQQSVDSSFIRVPYTTGGVIDVAWPIVRDFANMLLVLILIFIGLGTALRLGDYEAKKALPRLVAIALLINFAPVLMGFVVDASNIIMNFFLEGLLGGQVLASVGSNLSAIIGSNTETFGQLSFSFVAKLSAVALFNMLTAVIFFFFAALFFVRKVVIWILVILSPIALISLILPATKGFFTKWWDQFFQWSTVGIFAAFFLWLGDHTIALAARGGFTSQIAPQGSLPGTTGLGNILNEVMPFIIADMVLLIGFFMGLQSNAMGFNTLKSQSFGQQKWAALKTGAFLKRFKDEKLSQSTLLQGRPGKPEEGLANKLAASKILAPTWGSGKDGIGGAFARTSAWATRAAFTPISGGLRKVGRALGPNIIDEQKQIIAKTAQESKKLDVPTVVSRLKDHAVSQADKVGLLHRLIVEFDIGDAMKQGLTMGEIGQLRESARRRGEHHEIDVAFPELARKDVERKVVEDRAEENEKMRQMGLAGPYLPEITTLPPDDQKKLFEEAFQDNYRKLLANHPERAAWIPPSAITPEIGEAMLKFFDGRQMGAFAKWQGKTGMETLQAQLNQLAADYAARTGTPITKGNFLEILNPALRSYMEKNAGQEVSLDLS